METVKANFILKDFRQVADFRVFTFERIAADHSRSLFTVGADMALARRHRIRLQELPLLCKALLDQQTDSGEVRMLVFTEGDMRRVVNREAERAEAARQRRTPRRPPTENLGASWRSFPGR